MSVDDPKRPTDWSLVKRLWPFLSPNVIYFVFALMLAPLTALLSVAQPWLLKIALDDHIMVGDIAGTRNVALLYILAVLISWALEVAYMYSLSLGALGAITKLRSVTYRHTMSLGRTFFDHQPKGRLLTRVTSDNEALGETLTAGSVTIVLDALKMIGVLIAMFILDPWLTLLILLFAPVIGAVVEVLRRILRKLYQEIRTSLSELNGFTTERINGVELVQLYVDEMRSLRLFDARLKRYRDAAIRTNIYDASMYAILDGLSSITVALLLWYGSGGLMEGVVTAGLLAAFISYVRRLYQPIQEFSAKVAVFQRAASAMEKIFGLLAVEDRVADSGHRLEDPKGHIVIRDLSFAYGDGPRILDGVSLEVRPGEVVALVGRTGSGKSTLGRVITRAYGGYGGSVTLDGVELKDVDLRQVREVVGSVQQDVQLFGGDVRFNLTLGRDVSDERLLECIALARAEQTVERLGGLDGRIETRGGNLSVGEAQLLSLARTLVTDSAVVVMDEATANVDTLTEARIQEATQALLERKTVLVIAHRLSTIIHSDRICVMQAGKVAEIGSHQELLEAGGLYAGLFRQQFE